MDGPSWAKGRLFFYESCPGGCDASGTYAFDPIHDTYGRARASKVLSGFAIADEGAHAYEAITNVPPDSTSDQLCDGAGCTLLLSDRLAFSPAFSLVRRYRRQASARRGS